MRDEVEWDPVSILKGTWAAGQELGANHADGSHSAERASQGEVGEVG